MPEQVQKKTLNLPTLKRVFGLAMPYKTMFWIAAIIAVVLAPLVILRPLLIKETVDNQILQSDYKGLVYMIMILFAVLIIEVLLKYAYIYIVRLLGQSVIRDLRVKVFKHITNLRLTYFDRTPIGQSTTRVINDVEAVNIIFSEGAIAIIADVLTLVFVLGYMFFLSWKLTLICLITIPLLLWATYIFKEKVKAATQVIRTQISEMNTFLQERITGMRIVQIFNAEEQEYEEFDRVNKKYLKANLDTITYYAIFFPVVELLSAVSLGLTVWYGASQVLDKEVEPGIFIVFPLLLGMLFRPIRMLADKFNNLQNGIIAADRIFDLLDKKDFITNEGTQVIDKITGSIEFQNVYFSYDQDGAEDKKTWIIDDVSFMVNPGETLAIVGSTGSGKTTLINILSRFYEINQGAVKIDGVSLSDLELDSYRSKLAVVLQDVFLFTGTVLDNIRLRDDSISKDKVVASAKLIGAHEFIMNLPGEYDFEILERGNNISLGQRQLISFVRALVFEPEILILDEATSSIDPETEGVIQFAVDRLVEDRTSIVIAHRLSTIKNADKILVMDKGQAKEIGSHEELLLKGGIYSNLYNIQYSKEQNPS